MLKLTKKEIDILSTIEERNACWQWKALQQRCRDENIANEGDLMLASQLIKILVARNKRLGLI